MLISYNWLRELTDTKLTPLELRERLTMVGLAIDSVAEIAGDSVLDVEVPSNRPDCLSHVGIAREVAVIEKSNVQSPTSKVCATEGRASDLTAVEISDEDLCPRYAARVVRGVKIGPSPEWLQKRLGEIGQRPINNVADITNYVLHELGQPLHAFDLAKLTAHRIVVRRAVAGEKLTTLDGAERELDSEMLVIADAVQPVALAGIMGGLESEISSSTTEVLIESAYFNPDSVRRTARKLGMDTEASRRFERGADCENVLQAQTRCVELICELAGGLATDDAIDVYPNPTTAKVISFRPSRIESLTSVRVDSSETKRILAALGFVEQPGSPELSTFVVPSWRIDVSLEEDLVEEVVRHVGYDQITSELPPSNFAGEYQPSEMKRRALRRAFTGLGFDEAISFSFIDVAHDGQFELLPALQGDAGAPAVTLGNPIIDDATRMRPTLLPGLIESVRHNFNHGNRDVRLFEIGRVFAGSEDRELPDERESVALIATGNASEEGYVQSGRETDFLEFKGALEAAIAAMQLQSLLFSKASVKHLREGQAATISLSDGTAIGTIGRLAETIASNHKFRQPVYVAELDLTALLGMSEQPIQYAPLPRYPSVSRDVTLLIDREVSFAQLVQFIAGEDVENCTGVKLVGVYEGANIPADKRSITLRMEYRSDERTLRDDEVEAQHRVLLDATLAQFKAALH
jgi:phenylalanyl-tRNA synthetase beta chain